MIHIERGDETPVVMPPLRVNPEPQPGKQPRKHLHHKRQRIPLMPLVNPHRQNRPAGKIIVGIGGSIALPVHNPPHRNRLAPVPRQRDFPQSHGAGRHIHQHRPRQIAGHTDADRIGSQLARPPPKGRHVLGGRPGISGNQPNHPLRRRHRRVIPQPPDMTLLTHRNRRHAITASLVDCHPHRPFRDHKAETPIPVDHRSAGRLPLHHKSRPRHDMPRVNAVGISGNLDHAVGIVAAQIGLDQMRRHHLRLRLRRAFGAVNMIGRLAQIIRRKYGHNKPLTQR